MARTRFLNFLSRLDAAQGGQGAAMTYDVEMAPDGPLNYLANHIVSHNSHACAYAWVAYQTAYLKANYSAEFMAATLAQKAFGGGPTEVEDVE